MAESIEGLDELNNRIEELNQTLNNFSSSLQSQMRASSQTFGENTSSVSKNSTAVANSTRLSEIQDQVERDQAKRRQEQEANYLSAKIATANALRSFGSAIVSAEQGFKKYGQSITQAGEAVANLSKNLPIFGGVIGGLIRIVTSFASTALRSVDVLVDFRDEVSKTSGALPVTLRSIQDLGMQAGYSGERLLVLQKITAGLGTSLQGLGGTAGTGVVKFMQLAEVSETVRDRFGRMGVDQERLTDLQAKYVQMQAASGMQYQLQNKSMAQLRKESLDYADNMTRLSSLTGKQADQIQQEQEQVQLEFEEQAAEMADRVRIRQLREADRHKEADQLEKSVNARNAVTNNLSTLFGPELSSQMSRVFRTGFFDSKSGPLAQIMPELVGYSERLRNLRPGDDAEKVTADIFNTVKRKYEEGAIDFETVLQVLGEEGARSLGYSAETFKRLNSYTGKSYEKLMEDVERDRKASQQADDLADETQELRNAEIRLQREFQRALVPLANVLMPMITSTMTYLANSFETVLKPILEGLGRDLGWLHRNVMAWIESGGFDKVRKGLDDVGNAFIWLKDNIKTLVVIGGVVIAFTALGQAIFGLIGIISLLKGAGLMGGSGGAAAGIAGGGGAAGLLKGGAGGLLKGGARLLGKVALPLMGAMALYDAFQGFNADPNASFGGKMANAGRGALSGLTFGLSEHLTGKVTTGTPEAENKESIKKHSEQVVTDTKQRKENIEQNKILAKNAKEQTTEQTRLFRLLTDAIKSTTSSLTPFRMSIEDIVSQMGVNSKVLQNQLPDDFGDYGSHGPSGGGGGAGGGGGGGGYGAEHSHGGSRGSRPQLSSISAQGHTALVATEVAPKMQQLLDGMTKVGYRINSLGGYNDRNIAGRNTKSAHSRGWAIDVNPETNPHGSQLVTDMPREVVHLARSLGLGWGGDWRSSKDAMHFSAQRNEGGWLKAARGGVFSGPKSGYPMEMHGTEMVAPLNVDSILMKLAKTPVGAAEAGAALDSIMQTGSSSSVDIEKLVSAQFKLIEILSNKLDVVVDALETGNYTQSKILMNSMS
jgi:hypothetical protein